MPRLSSCNHIGCSSSSVLQALGFLRFPHLLAILEHISVLVGTGSLRNCEKNVQNTWFSGPYFCAFVLNTERFYGVSLLIQSKCGKILTRKTPYLDTFHAVRGSSEVCTAGPSVTLFSQDWPITFFLVFCKK